MVGIKVCLEIEGATMEERESELWFCLLESERWGRQVIRWRGAEKVFIPLGPNGTLSAALPHLRRGTAAQAKIGDRV